MANDLLYYTPAYLDIQRYGNLLVYQDDHYIICLELKDGVALSLPNSPFGGFLCKMPPDGPTFSAFLQKLESTLVARGISSLVITQPPSYYKHFVADEWLLSNGFQPQVTESNQVVDLTSYEIHDMEKRKLKRCADLKIRKLKGNELGECYDFIAKCRAQQGLEVNIPKKKYLELTGRIPDAYDCYAGYMGKQLAVAVLTAKPTSEVVYYYLPATDQEFKKESPMVKLMVYLYEVYREEGFRYFDLGISSIRGKLQSSLFKFKERMGAEVFERNTFKKLL